MKIVLSDHAILRLREIQAHVAYDNVSAATRVIARIRQTIEILTEHPKIGKHWDEDTRALGVAGLPYRVHYSVNEDETQIDVISFVHTSQKPPQFN